MLLGAKSLLKRVMPMNKNIADKDCSTIHLSHIKHPSHKVMWCNDYILAKGKPQLTNNRFELTVKPNIRARDNIAVKDKRY